MEHVKYFRPFEVDISAYQLPERFTFPFYYEPHPLAIVAAEALQEELSCRTDLGHNFGLDPEQEGLVIGKMFGVLVVQTPDGRLGYLAAFSGKLGNSNLHEGFVPPIFDMLTEGSFFLAEEQELNKLNRALEKLLADPAYHKAKEALTTEIAATTAAIEEHKTALKAARTLRKAARASALETHTAEAYEKLRAQHEDESIKYSVILKRLQKKSTAAVAKKQEIVDAYEDEIQRIQTTRKDKSNALQKRLFDQYQFLNAKGDVRSVLDIFRYTTVGVPTAGAGECAAPKLLQYAFENTLRPIALAEFWWGASPKSEIRKHKYYYPACRGKCEPILGHMLEGLAVDPNPMKVNTAEGQTLPIVYEDDILLVTNKPPEFLSVPGKMVADSVASRMKARYPDATGPLIVHRLDMSTSGLLLIAKTVEMYKLLQHQFMKRTIKKRYIALLDGDVEGDEGFVDLPMRLDIEDRPRQLVCYEHGKNARTRWEVISRADGRTRVYLYPITGRTHQLRVHCAHKDGLNAPILGDDLYGRKGDRLHLHAEYLAFMHPHTKETVELEAPAAF